MGTRVSVTTGVTGVVPVLEDLLQDDVVITTSSKACMVIAIFIVKMFISKFC
jgi:hypothetical protein